MRTLTYLGAVGAILLASVLAGPRAPRVAEAQTPSAPSTAAQPENQPPAELPLGPLSEEELRRQLVAQKQGLCEELELIAGIIISTGTLRDVPTTILGMTGLPIDELEARETRACQQQPDRPKDEQKSTTELLNEVRTTEWLVRMHLAAMDQVLMQQPTFRPIEAEGSFRTFFEMHNISIQDMRDRYLALSEEPTVEEARAMAAFWREALIPHARAEDRALWPLARSRGDDQLERTANLLESEHTTIDQGIERYNRTLEVVEQGQAPVAELATIARDIRIRTELHFR